MWLWVPTAGLLLNLLRSKCISILAFRYFPLSAALLSCTSFLLLSLNS